MKKYLPAVSLTLVVVGIYIFMTLVLIYSSYQSTALDLGLFVQMMKNTLHGQIMVLSANGTSQFATHFSPVLFFVVPFYWLFPYAQTLLVIQAVSVGAAGFLIYYLARYFELSNKMSLFIELLYLVNPLTWGVLLGDFHEACFAMALILVTIIGLLKKNWWMFGIGLFLSLMIKEDITVTLIFFGISMLIFNYFKQRKVSRVAIVIIIAGVVTLITGFIVSSIASQGMPKILWYLKPSGFGSSRYDYFNMPLSQAAYKLAENVLSGWSVLLFLSYFLPLGFFPLGLWKWTIPALFVFAINDVSTFYGQHNQLSQYSAGAIPFLFVAGVVTLAKPKWREIFSQTGLSHKVMIAVSSVALLFVSISVSFLVLNRGNLLTIPTPHDRMVDKVLAMVPNGATVTACDYFEPHLISRTDAYLCPEPNVKGLIFGTPINNTEYVVIDDKIVENTGWEDTIRNDSGYTLIYQLDGCQLYQRRDIE